MHLVGLATPQTWSYKTPPNYVSLVEILDGAQHRLVTCLRPMQSSALLQKIQWDPKSSLQEWQSAMYHTETWLLVDIILYFQTIPVFRK